MVKTLLTYQDLVATPDDGRRYELVEGELQVSPAPSLHHQRILRQLTELFMRARAAGYGTYYFAPVDVIFDAAERNTAQPDAFFIRQERRQIATTTVVRGAPDLIVEVLSPSTRAYDLRAKRQLYARFQVPYYWAVDPETRTVQCFTLAGAEYAAPQILTGDARLGCPLFPEITTPVATLFAED